MKPLLALIPVFLTLTFLTSSTAWSASETNTPTPSSQVSLLKKEGNVVTLQSGEKTLRITVLTAEMVRVQVTTNSAFKPSLIEGAGFVKTDWPACKAEVKDQSDAITITTDALSVKVTKTPFALEIVTADGKSLFRTAQADAMDFIKGPKLTVEMTPEDHFFGFGYMRKCCDARGNTLTWTRSYRNNEATIPFFMNPRGYAFLSINTWKTDFDFTHPEAFTIGSQAGDLDFFVMVGDDFPKLLNLYTDLTGKPQMVPKWTLGLEHRSRSFDNEQDVMRDAKLFRKYNIPCELMALEPGWEEIAYSMVWKFSTTRFPHYKEMISDLKKMGFKFDLWESGVAPMTDILNPEVRKKWFSQREAALTNWGIDMFKQDDPYPRSISSIGMNDAQKVAGTISEKNYQPGEIMTVANSFYSQTAFEEWRKLTGKRPVIQFHAYNASFASQRWPYQWAGDFGTGWGLINASLSAHMMANGDARNPYPEGRHMDFLESAGPVNDCWAYFIEPWSYSDRLIETTRLYASLRARLYPYLYTAMAESHETGIPILRPMVLLNPTDTNTYKIATQYFLGDSLLVATTVALDQFGDAARTRVNEEIPMASSAEEGNTPVYLTKGLWTDYWSGKEYSVATNQWITCSFPSYAGGPLLVKEGGIIPTTQVKQYTEQWPDELLTLDIYPSEKPSTHQLYEDDEISFGYEKGAFAKTSFSVEKKGTAISINLGKRAGDYQGKPAYRSYLLKVHSMLAPSKVLIDGKELPPATKNQILLSSESSGWYYDATENKIIIKPSAGWNYPDSGRNPAGTYPLTPAQEQVSFTEKTDHSTADSRIEIALNHDPKARVGAATQVLLTPENNRVLADGKSSVKISIALADANGNTVNEDRTLSLKLKGAGELPESVALKEGKGEILYTAASEPGIATIKSVGDDIASQKLTIQAEKGTLQLKVNPPKKIRLNKTKGEWLAHQFGIAVSVRDKEDNRLSAQSKVHLEIRDYKNREVIQRDVTLVNGEAELRGINYTTRPEKFIITATAEGCTPASFKAFENTWNFPDDYFSNKAIKSDLFDMIKE